MGKHVMNNCLLAVCMCLLTYACVCVLLLFSVGLETAFLGPSGTGTVWPVLSSPLKNRLALRGEGATLMILASFGERNMTTVFKLALQLVDLVSLLMFYVMM